MGVLFKSNRNLNSYRKYFYSGRKFSISCRKIVFSIGIFFLLEFFIKVLSHLTGDIFYDKGGSTLFEQWSIIRHDTCSLNGCKNATLGLASVSLWEEKNMYYVWISEGLEQNAHRMLFSNKSVWFSYRKIPIRFLFLKKFGFSIFPVRKLFFPVKIIFW